MTANVQAYLFSFFILILTVNSNVFAVEDIAGSSDHPELPRITGSNIIAHFKSEYGEHESIVKSLTTEFGIDSARLIPIGVGLAAPVSTNSTEEGRSLNRRVELVERTN